MKKSNYIFATAFILILTAGIFLINFGEQKKFSHKQTNLTNKIYLPQHTVNSSEIIMPSTKMVYNYYYQKDGCIETTAETAPYFLIGMNEQELKKTFRDWKVCDFSKEKVIMQKNADCKSNQHYIIGIKDGYVAVFYQQQINGTNLKEITNTPANSLSHEDRKRLENGIKISGEDKLIAIMQDYES